MLCSTEMIWAGAYMYHEMVMSTVMAGEYRGSEDHPHLPSTQPDCLFGTYLMDGWNSNETLNCTFYLLTVIEHV